MQGSIFLLYCSCTVTHYSFCVCLQASKYGLVVSSQRLKTIEKFKPNNTAVSLMFSVTVDRYPQCWSMLSNNGVTLERGTHSHSLVKILRLILKNVFPKSKGTKSNNNISISICRQVLMNLSARGY